MAIENVNTGSFQTNITPFNGKNGNISTYNSSGLDDGRKGTYRGLGSDWFNSANIAYEDFMRNEQAQDTQLSRDLFFQGKANEFNAQEAQKQRDFEERMSNTSYQRMVEDLKKAGLNPVLAVSQGGASTPSGATASSGGSRKTNRAPAGYGANTSSLVGSILSLIAGVYTAGASNAAKIAATKMVVDSKSNNSNKWLDDFNRRWRDAGGK